MNTRTLVAVVAGLSLVAGTFGTIFGAEVAESWLNLNYTRGELYFNLQPFWHTGIKAEYAKDAFVARALVVNEPNNSTLNNGAINVAGQLGFVSDAFSAYGGLMLDAQLVLPALPALSAHIGAGAGGISITDTEAVDQDALKGTGGAYYAVGLAYDLFPFYDKGSGGFSVVPHLQAHYMPGNIVNAWFFVAGLELTWWTGLDRDKLDLPYEEQYQRGDQ